MIISCLFLFLLLLLHCLAASLFQQQRSTEFQDMIISVYNETTRYLRSILDDKYHMMDHFKAIKRYLLLGQGDFIKYLMDLMETELNKAANQVFYHNLQSLMDAAIRVTNAQYENEDIIRRLDLRLMYVSPSELGWDVCCLDYKFDGPLRTIFTEENSLRYMRIFNHLWRVKRMEYTTCGVWKQLMKSSRQFALIPG
jgi:gamma-tubulin complex component 3